MRYPEPHQKVGFFKFGGIFEMRVAKSPATIFSIIGALFIIASAVEISVGPMWLPIGRILPDAIAYFHGSRSADAVVMGAIRLPRVFVAAFVGASLASTGAVLQAIFRNPMADPGIIGVSSGGALGAVTAIQTGLAAQGAFVLPLSAFVSGLLAVFVIYGVATVNGRTSLYSLLLVGVAISVLCGAGVDLVLSLAPLQTMQQVMFWLMGGLDGSTWTNVALILIFWLVGFMIFFLAAPALDLMSLGEEQAHGVGVRVEWVKRLMLATAALVIGACISVSGTIGFVGLIVPHILRLIIGPRHRLLIPASALGGALLLIIADVIARTVLMPVEINVGIVTSCLGVPFFLYLLRRQQRT